VDLEDWYQGLTRTSQQIDRWPEYPDRVVETTEKLLGILAAEDVRATFFTLGYLADQFPSLIRKIAEAGHELALHGYYHYPVFRLTPEVFRQEMLRGREAVEAASGQAVWGYRAPMFSINRASLWALEVLRELGFQYDSSLFPTRNMLYGFPGAPRYPYRPFEGHMFVEFPVSTVRFMGITWPIAGGFYLRILPYPMVRWGIRRLNRQGFPAVLYTHPWELDLEQPCIPVSPRERVTHFGGRTTLEAKLRLLCRDFQLVPLGELCHQWPSEHSVPERDG
jgi:polysaccharide deacetylase family protein (PEP-CTERM system associated)